MWREGSIKIGEDIFHYWIKQYGGGSVHGIEGGRISKNVLPERTKLYIRKNRIKEGHCAEIRYIIRLAI